MAVQNEFIVIKRKLKNKKQPANVLIQKEIKSEEIIAFIRSFSLNIL